MDALLAFLAARLDDDEQQALLFHELHCLLSTLPSWVSPVPAEDQERCGCPIPSRLVATATGRRTVLADCAHRFAHPHPGTSDQRWPPDTGLAQRTLHTLARTYSAHPGWQEHWRP